MVCAEVLAQMLTRRTPTAESEGSLGWSVRALARRTLPLSVLLLVAVVPAVGVSAWGKLTGPSDRLFDSCARVSGQLLVLTYIYGVGDEVFTTVVSKPERVEVRLQIKSPGGDRSLAGFTGRQEVSVPGLADKTVMYPDGTELACPARR